MSKKSSVIALIPARFRSKRIKNKNVRILAGHPLIAYTIQIAKQAGIFSRIIVSTESEKIAEIAKYYGAEAPFLRPSEYATDKSPDIYWIKYTLKKLGTEENHIEYFSILRPTSPFRSVNMIKRGWKLFQTDKNADSLRAVERCLQHPAKMWLVKDNRMRPVMENPVKDGIEWFSTPMQVLPQIFAQNSSLEIAKCVIPLQTNSISGTNIIPFETSGFEGYDINTEKDWIYAEYLIKYKKVRLPI